MVGGSAMRWRGHRQSCGWAGGGGVVEEVERVSEARLEAAMMATHRDNGEGEVEDEDTLH
jgi:hypothetical protein